MRGRVFSWLLLCVALSAFGCEGPEGPRGPAGAPGTANVIYSEWYSPATWEQVNVYGVIERQYTMTTSELTQEIIDHGAVLVYMRFVGIAPQINQLPVNIIDPNYDFLFRAQAGSITAAYYSVTSPGTAPNVIPSSNVVRYVLIPGGVLDETALIEGVTSGRLIESLDHMLYADLCGMLGIPE